MTSQEFDRQYPSPKRPSDSRYFVAILIGCCTIGIGMGEGSRYLFTRPVGTALGVLLTGGLGYGYVKIIVRWMDSDRNKWIKSYNRWLRKRIKHCYPNYPFSSSNH